MKRSIGLLPFAWFVLWLPGASGAVDPLLPAQVRLTVLDEEGRRLPDVPVRLTATPWGPEVEPIEWTTDAEGVARFERLRPRDASRVTWNEWYRVELPGYVPSGVTLTLFPGAEQEGTIRLERQRETLLRLRGPRGEPLPRVGFGVVYSWRGYTQTELLFTDEEGNCIWRHGELQEGFRLFTDRSDWMGSKRYEPETVVTVTFDPETVPTLVPRLEGRLLHANGSVATGWRVARRTRSGFGGGGIPGPMYQYVQFDELHRVGSDGRFKMDAVESLLMVVSPEGIPVLYAIDPTSWRPGVRRTTLRLPKMLSEHRGVVVDEEGEPVAGLPIQVSSMTWNGENWTFHARGPVGEPGIPLPEATTTDGEPFELIETDAHGEYTLPQYPASYLVYRPEDERVRLEDLDGLGYRDRNVRKLTHQPLPPEGLSRFKQITVHFQDEQGSRVGDVTVANSTGFKGEKTLSRGRGYADSRGIHLFLNREVRRIELETRDTSARLVERRWQPTTKVIELDGTESQSVRVTLEEPLLMLPLSGTVLDPEGNPVSKASVSLLKPESERTRGSRHLGAGAVTDEQGRFQFEAAPDECFVGVNRWLHESKDLLPGWADETPVIRDTRELTIRLKPAGAVRLQIPEGLENAENHLWLARTDASSRWEANIFSFHERDQRPGELVSVTLRPGEYTLEPLDEATPLTEWLGQVGPVRVTVSGGEETVIDLREFDLPIPPGRTRDWTAIQVEQEGQPVAGAEVTVYTAVARPEDLDRWFRQWEQGEESVRNAAVVLLRHAGALAVDAIESRGNELDAGELLREMFPGHDFDDPGRDEIEPLLWDDDLDGVYVDIGELSQGSDGLMREFQGLSDDAGRVRCRLREGDHCVAVARVRGRLIGWRTFTASGEPVTVPLRPSRTVATGSPARLKLDQPLTLGERALMSHLTDAHGGFGWGDMHGTGILSGSALLDRDYPLKRRRIDGQNLWIMEDLPIDAECLIRFVPQPDSPHADQRHTVPITIQSGQSVQMVPAQ